MKLRPDWHSDALEQGMIKVAYSGTAQDEPPISKQLLPLDLVGRNPSVASAR